MTRQHANFVFTFLMLISLATMSSAVLEAQETYAPFGLTKGLSVPAVRKRVRVLTKVAIEQYTYTTDSVPRPHHAFELYALIITPSTGLCKIVGIGRTIDNDNYGTELREAFRQLQEPLTAKYGQPHMLDSLDAEYGFKDSASWMMSLYEKQRTYAAAWAGADSAGVGGGIAAITLEAVGLSPSDGFLRLSYFLDNFNECYAEITKDAL